MSEQSRGLPVFQPYVFWSVSFSAPVYMTYLRRGGKIYDKCARNFKDCSTLRLSVRTELTIGP